MHGKGKRRVGVGFSDQLHYSKFVKNMHIPIYFFAFPQGHPLRSPLFARGGFDCQDCFVILGGIARAEGGYGRGWIFWSIALFKIRQKHAHTNFLFCLSQKGPAAQRICCLLCHFGRTNKSRRKAGVKLLINCIHQNSSKWQWCSPTYNLSLGTETYPLLVSGCRTKRRRRCASKWDNGKMRRWRALIPVNRLWFDFHPLRARRWQTRAIGTNWMIRMDS